MSVNGHKVALLHMIGSLGKYIVAISAKDSCISLVMLDLMLDSIFDAMAVLIWLME